MKLYNLCKKETLDLSLVEEAFDPTGIEGFGNVEEECAC
jgi:hypothetical protein